MEVPFGIFVRKRRKYLGFPTQAALAKALHITRDYVSWIERGKASAARLEGKTLGALSSALQVDEPLLRRWAYEGSAPSDAWSNGSHFKIASRSMGLCQIIMIAMEHRSVVEELLMHEDISKELVRNLLAQEEKTAEKKRRD